MANKTVMKTFDFKFATTLTALHFCLTAAAGVFADRMGQLSERRVPFQTVLWFSIVSDISVVTMNLSLMANSVGFYQIAKLSIIPTCCVMEAFILGKSFSNEVKASVVVVIMGVAICTVTDVSTTVFGIICAFVAVVSSSLQQIYIAQLQKQYKVGSFDLLSQTAPLQAVVLIAVGPFVDYLLTQRNLFNYGISFYSALALLMSCFLALFVNISAYLCIGKFSAVSFQVLGHMKTVLILIMGWIFFDSAVTVKNLGGMLIAVVGMILYSWAVEIDKARAAAAGAAPSSQTTAGKGKLGEEQEEGTPLLLKNGSGDPPKEGSKADKA